jgi:hypothetical protein
MSPPLKRGFIKFSLHRDGKTPDLNIVLKMSTYDPSTSISPQDWFAYFKDLMNKNYTSD